jgi:hypothetical protein
MPWLMSNRLSWSGLGSSTFGLEAPKISPHTGSPALESIGRNFGKSMPRPIVVCRGLIQRFVAEHVGFSPQAGDLSRYDSCEAGNDGFSKLDAKTSSISR